MTHRLLILGSGFAGMWSALSAARVSDLAGKPLDIVVLAPEARLGIRPRYYETDLDDVSARLDDLFDVTGVRFIAGRAELLDTDRGRVSYRGADGTLQEIAYDRLVLATGSQVRRPNLPGLADHAFDNDRLDHARDLQAHLGRLSQQPDTPSRATAVVVGGGFTGIETAAELPARLHAILGPEVAVRVVIVEQANDIGPELGPGPRPVIEQALEDLAIEVKLGVAVSAVDAEGVSLADGSRIGTSTVIWTGGLNASPLTSQIAGDHDPLGRLHVTSELRVIRQEHVFATGDAAFAATDDHGHYTLMSCQHAMTLGRVAGHNAAADLLGVAGVDYSQPGYGTCLDLGPWGAVLTEGWERKVKLAGAEAKAMKRHLNTQVIYPPRANRREAFAAADPARSDIA